MIRRIIHIDEEKCNGCGVCADTCHEGAIVIMKGKAKLVREDYCDGLGDCLPTCHAGAITFTEREAAAYDKRAADENKRIRSAQKTAKKMPFFGCPGARMAKFNRCNSINMGTQTKSISQLAQWPCQIKLVPVNAPYFDGADLLIAADCTAFAYADFHNDFMHGKITLIGCPKLDATDYSEKLTEILANNNIRNVTVLRMEVPCCGGIELAVNNALKKSGKSLPSHVTIITIDGKIAN